MLSGVVHFAKVDTRGGDEVVGVPRGPVKNPTLIFIKDKSPVLTVELFGGKDGHLNVCVVPTDGPLVAFLEFDLCGHKATMWHGGPIRGFESLVPPWARAAWDLVGGSCQH